MTIEQAYIQYTILVNRNASNNNITVDRPRFVISYNDMQNRWLEWTLEKRNEDFLRYAQKLLVHELSLNAVRINVSHDTYALPTNYFDFSNLVVFGKKDCCDKKPLRTFEVKSENTEELQADPNNTPSFEWEETFYFLTNDTVAVYKTDFDIDSVLLSYYRYPLQVDITGYTNLQNVASISINPEFDDKVVNRILLAMAKEFSATNNDANSYQLDKDRLFTKI